MRDAPIRLLCIAVLLVVGTAWLSTLSAIRWNAEADGVLQNGLNAGGVIESRQQAPPPILNPGKPPLPCPECKDWSGQWEGNRFVVRHKGRDVTREVVGSEAEMFSRTPLERR